VEWVITIKFERKKSVFSFLPTLIMRMDRLRYFIYIYKYTQKRLLETYKRRSRYIYIEMKEIIYAHILNMICLTFKNVDLKMNDHIILENCVGKL
jgi:hypothetical protein